ncbi:MAG: hypothetical protein L3K23_00240 [Thermoplasmata archaeon]|nr:hypothetical protein [Thermoplasmata archaeon]
MNVASQSEHTASIAAPSPAAWNRREEPQSGHSGMFAGGGVGAARVGPAVPSAPSAPATAPDPPGTIEKL